MGAARWESNQDNIVNSFSAVKIRLHNSWMWGIDKKTCSSINFYSSESSYPCKWYKLQTQSQSCSFPVTQWNVCSQYFHFNGFNIDVLVTIENSPFQLEDKFWNNFKITGRILFNSMYYLISLHLYNMFWPLILLVSLPPSLTPISSQQVIFLYSWLQFHDPLIFKKSHPRDCE